MIARWLWSRVGWGPLLCPGPGCSDRLASGAEDTLIAGDTSGPPGKHYCRQPFLPLCPWEAVLSPPGHSVRVGTSRSCQGLFGRDSAAAEHSSSRRAWGEAPRRAEMPPSVLARAAPCPWWCASILAGRRRQAVYTARLGKSHSESFSLLLVPWPLKCRPRPPQSKRGGWQGSPGCSSCCGGKPRWLPQGAVLQGQRAGVPISRWEIVGVAAQQG